MEFLFKIQVALIAFAGFIGLLLLMQRWRTVAVYIEHQVIYTFGLLHGPLYRRGVSSAPGVDRALCKMRPSR